jgi:hypothetical protein
MFLSPRHKILFVHIPKTGGTSIRSALKRLQWTDPYAVPIHLVNGLTRALKYNTGAKFPRHAKAIAAFECIGEPFWSQLFKFTFVRNPWDLQVSNWHYLNGHPKDPLSGLRDFEDFLRHMLRNDRPWDYHIDTHREVQSHFVTDHSGRVILDFIGRFERLQEDFGAACTLGGIRRVDLPHKRRSQERRTDYRSYYNDVTAELIAKHYSEDIRLFGYTFDDFGRELAPVGPLAFPLKR